MNAKGTPTSFACCTTDLVGNAYGGGANGKIYIVQENLVIKMIDSGQKSDGFVGALVYTNNLLIAGYQGGSIRMYNTDNIKDVLCIQVFYVGYQVRALDMKDGLVIVGLRNGNIEELSVEDGS